MLGIPQYLWRLVPANPIMLRVVGVGGKRTKDLIARCVYLGLLIGIVLITLVGADAAGGDLDELTAISTELFIGMSYLQLALVALLAPIFTAGAITQEKDSQTYDILLSTPLTNGQIVLGTLLSRLFFVFALLISGIPVFGITQIFGGVGIREILLVTGVAAVTALLTGAFAVAIATFKVGTRRTIFSFYFLIVVYLVGGWLIDAGADPTHPILADGSRAETGWLTAIHPFLALRSILDPVDYAPPAVSELSEGLRGWPWSFYLSKPAAFFMTAGTLVSLLLVVPSIVLLRRMAQSTLTPAGWINEKLSFLPGFTPRGDRPARSVWNNPIAWREARTKASAARSGLLRYAFILLGVGGAGVAAWLYANESAEPDTYVTAGSINPVTRTVFIRGLDGGTYALSPTVSVRVNGEDVTFRDADRRLAVQTPLALEVRNGAPTITRLNLSDVGRRLAPETARNVLLGLVLLEVATILLIVTNASASTVTREREDGSLDLLLSTPITSRYYIWGKLRGLVSFALPLIVVPVASIAAFVLADLFAGGTRPLVLPESLLTVPLLLVVMVAFAAIVGMNLSLRTGSTVKSVMASLGVVLGLFALLGWCGTAIAASGEGVTLAFTAFSPLSVMMIQIDPATFADDTVLDPQDGGVNRAVLTLFTLVACGAYAGGVWTLYKSMVKNFDMTIRRQQR
ncbi:MAG: ABC transporter permease subunit [Planctomycetota bacterium]